MDEQINQTKPASCDAAGKTILNGQEQGHA